MTCFSYQIFSARSPNNGSLSPIPNSHTEEVTDYSAEVLSKVAGTSKHDSLPISYFSRLQGQYIKKVQ